MAPVAFLSDKIFVPFLQHKNSGITRSRKVWQEPKTESYNSKWFDNLEFRLEWTIMQEQSSSWSTEEARLQINSSIPKRQWATKKKRFLE